jgi:predicted oxidoreductase
MLWFSELPLPPGARILPFCDGLLAPDGLEYVPLQLASFIEEHLDLGITTVDHADIYGGYQCEAAFGEALKLVPALRDRMEIVTKCGIATTAKPEHALGHYITDSAHIIKSAEQSLVNLATDRIDLLLIHRPDPLMDADEVAEAFLNLHQSGKVRHFGVSNFTPAQFALLQSRLPFTLATNQVEISRFTSRCCWTVRSISCNSCAFARWRGRAWGRTSV